MSKLKLNREKILRWGFLPALTVLLLLAGFVALKTVGDSMANSPEIKAVGREKYLYVWSGDQARKNPDFLAVVNFDENSPNYGKMITTVPLPAPGNTWNEPHH